jgi:TetR/AcrR family transcriptional repressor of nem operon
MFGNLTLELSNQTEPIRQRLQQIFDAQVEMVAQVIAEAQERGDVSVRDTVEAARSIVAQLEGQVLFAKLYNSTQRLETLWENCLSLLSAHRPDTAPVSS